MIRTEPIIGVKNVEKSSAWYQNLLGCKSMHGGEIFEILADQDDSVILCLHTWEEHGHPSLIAPTTPCGNGLILYFRVNNIDEIWRNAKHMNADIEEEPHINQNSKKEEFFLRDLDGYYISISS